MSWKITPKGAVQKMGSTSEFTTLKAAVDGIGKKIDAVVHDVSRILSMGRVQDEENSSHSSGKTFHGFIGKLAATMLFTD